MPKFAFSIALLAAASIPSSHNHLLPFARCRPIKSTLGLTSAVGLI